MYTRLLYIANRALSRNGFIDYSKNNENVVAASLSLFHCIFALSRLYLLEGVVNHRLVIDIIVAERRNNAAAAAARLLLL